MKMISKWLIVLTTIICLFSCSKEEAEEDPLKVNLLLNYKFDENTIDSSTNKFDGNGVAINYTLDRFGNENSAILFNGWSTYVDFPNLSDLKPLLPVSFSFWVKYDSESYKDRDLFNTSFNPTKSSGVYFNSQSSTGKYAINFGDGSQILSSDTRRTFISESVIEVGIWHHVAIIVPSSGEMNIFIDGVITKGEYFGNGGELQYSNDPGTIGRHYRGFEVINYFKGALDDFAYWNRSLTADEVLEIFKRTSL